MNCAPSIIRHNSGHLQARIPAEFPATVEVQGASPADIKDIGGGGGGNFITWTSKNKYPNKDVTLILRDSAGNEITCDYDANGEIETPPVSNAVYNSVDYDSVSGKVLWNMGTQEGIVSYDVFGSTNFNVEAVDGQSDYSVTLGLFDSGTFNVVANGEDGQTFDSLSQDPPLSAQK